MPNACLNRVWGYFTCTRTCC